MINVKYARNIAKAVKRNKNILRYIHFSAAGATEDSPSIDLRTKAIAEKEIRDITPDVTILRPTTIYGMNDYFIKNWYTQRDYFYHFNLVTDDCTAKRQPILVNDIAQCVLNALKIHESKGKTYDLAGPHTYSKLECYEILHNIIQTPPKLVYFPHDIALKVAQNFYNWEYFSLDRIIKDKLDLVASD
jgi:NADH dehydrogenase (ubiquinone) 1 alpha subcomplex subunit 9